MLQAIAHVMACKCANNKCLMRDMEKLVLDYADEFPAFNRLFKMQVHCALLGNLPKAEARPWLAARLRINASFVCEHGGPSTPIRKSALGGWITSFLYPLMFMMREMLIYTIERDVVLSDIMDASYHWLQHKRITRTCNGDVRRPDPPGGQESGRSL